MIFKGNFLYTPALGELTVREGEYLVVDGEKCAGFYRALPQEYAGQSVTDFGRALVLPAFCDLHLHAPQMVNRGVGYDQELLDMTVHGFRLFALWRPATATRTLPRRRGSGSSTGCGPTAPCAFPPLPPSTRRPPGG